MAMPMRLDFAHTLKALQIVWPTRCTVPPTGRRLPAPRKHLHILSSLWQDAQPLHSSSLAEWARGRAGSACLVCTAVHRAVCRSMVPPCRPAHRLRYDEPLLRGD